MSEANQANGSREPQSSKLTAVEREQLAKLESRIEGAQRLFLEIGHALAEINETRLYRESHRTFEEYVGDRFGWQRGHAYNLIAAYEAADNLKTQGLLAPANEFQVRPLMSLPAERQCAVWELATKQTGGKITHKAVKAAVAVVTGKVKPTIVPVKARVIDSEDDPFLQSPGAREPQAAQLGEINLMLLTSLGGTTPAQDARELASLLVDFDACVTSRSHLLVFCPHHDFRDLLNVAEAKGFHVGVPVVVDVCKGRQHAVQSFVKTTVFVLHLYKPDAVLFDPIGNLLDAHDDDLTLRDKPDLLLADLIESVVPPGATVCDPTVGADSTARACRRTKRVFVAPLQRQIAA